MRPSPLPLHGTEAAPAPLSSGASHPTVVPIDLASRAAAPQRAETPVMSRADLDALLHETEHDLRSSYLFDARTGLLHRELFLDRLGQAAAGVQRGGASFAVLVVSADFGEDGPSAMALMETLGQRLVALGRHTDSFTRLDASCHAGLLLGNHSIGGAIAMAQKIVDTVGSLAPRKGARAGFPARAGVAMCPQHGSDPRTLLLNAHAAMLHTRGAPGVPVSAQRLN